MTLSNADRIRSMSDEELNNFLWTFKVNQLSLFYEHGFTKTMDWKQQMEWLQSEDNFVVPETLVPEDMTYGQDFKEKEESN